MEARRRSERGNVMLFALLCLPLVIVSMALGVDIARGHAVQIMQKHELDDAQQAVLVRQEQVKYATDPAGLCRELVQESLEQDGFVGTAQLSYLERYHKRQPGSAADDERHVVAELVLCRGIGSSFGLWRGVPASDSVVWTMVPYASYQVFRPPSLADADGATYGRRYLLEFTREGDRSLGTLRSESPLDAGGLSHGALAALDALALS